MSGFIGIKLGLPHAKSMRLNLLQTVRRQTSNVGAGGAQHGFVSLNLRQGGLTLALGPMTDERRRRLALRRRYLTRSGA